jgi:hypothetical protein
LSWSNVSNGIHDSGITKTLIVHPSRQPVLLIAQAIGRCSAGLGRQ